MRYIDQAPLIDLRVTFADPPGKALLIQSRLPLQGRTDRVNDKVQEVSFIATITIRTGEDNPIGSAGFYQRSACGSGGTLLRRERTFDFFLRRRRKQLG